MVINSFSQSMLFKKVFLPFYTLIVSCALLGCGHSKEKQEEIHNSIDTIHADKGIAQLTKQIAQYPQSQYLYYERAKLYLIQRNITGASDDIQKAIALDSTQAPFYITLADVFLA